MNTDSENKKLSLQVSNAGMKSPNTLISERRLKMRSAELSLNNSEIHMKNDFSCCGAVYDKRCLTFLVQCTISFSIMLLSTVKLLSGVNESDKTIYVSMMTSVFSYWVSAPSLKEK
jgi:hypothetical protein